MKVRVDRLDDTTLHRTAEIKLRDATLETPVASVERKKVTSSLPISADIQGVNEIWRTVKKDDIEGYRTDPAAQSKLNRALDPPYRKGQGAGDVNILFLQCDTPNLTEEEVGFVADTAHAYSDIVPVPLVERLTKRIEEHGRDYFGAYTALVEGALEDIETLNNKPLMGALPVLPPALMTQLLDIYLDRGIRAFVVDFQGRTPSASEERNLRPVMKRLKDEGLEEDVILYALNANTGRSSGDLGEGVSPAKDILSFGFGFDVLGRKHLGMYGPKELFEKLAAQDQPEVRLFSKDQYTYRKTTPDGIPGIYPDDATLAMSRFADLATTSRKNDATHVVDMEQKAFEARELRTVINEQRVPDYLGGKEGLLPLDFERMKKAREGWEKQSSLRTWG